MNKTAYLWGPLSGFSGALAAQLLHRGWHVHIPTKSAFHVALSPLELRSSAQDIMQKALGGHDGFRTYQDRLRFLDPDEVQRGTKYDAAIFCGLPPNFDEPRASRAPWAADEFPHLSKKLKGVPWFIASSIWGAIQQDGVVPEEIECERRKPQTQYESYAQQYEHKLLKGMSHQDAPWYLVRLPMISSAVDGQAAGFTGPLTLLERLYASANLVRQSKHRELQIKCNPDGTLHFMPVDVVANIFARLIEDEARPRICNLVSTQATLNREWLQELGKAMGLKKIHNAEEDELNLPRFLRNALADTVQVKARGLFEVMGRYQQAPTVIDRGYFERCLAYAQEHNWGHARTKVEQNPVEFSPELATKYFEQFLQEHVDAQALKTAIAGGACLSFSVGDADLQTWLVRADNGQAVVEHNKFGQELAIVRFTFTEDGLVRLIQRKMSLERAMAMRQLKVAGKPMDVLRACQFLREFFVQHPFHGETNGHGAGEARQLQKSKR